MFYKIVRPLLILYVKLFYPFKVLGQIQKEKDGQPSVIVCNHLSMMDAFYIAYCFKRKIYFLCKEEMFKHKILAKIITKLGAVPIDRDNIKIGQLKQCLSLLKDNKTLAIFPEGTRNKTANPLLPLKEGAAVFAVKGKSNVIPMYIYTRAAAFRKNYIKIGEPFTLEEFEKKKLSADALGEITDIFAEKMLNLRGDIEKTLPEKTIKRLALKSWGSKK